MSTPVKYKVPDSVQNERLDTWLASQPDIGSRTTAAKFIEKNLVRVSGVAQLKVKASYRLRGGEEVEVTIPDPVASHIKPQDLPLEILYQDYDLAVVNKPAGMVTHPAQGHFENTLVNALLFHIKDLSDIGGVERPGLVHRLDKETSGVIVVAKNNKAHQGLSLLFKDHNIHRVYWALVAGVPKQKKGTITSFLARHPLNRKAFSSQPSGKKAVTHYEVVETYGNQISLLRITLETGRTHQIRVHMNDLGHPVLGDKVYGLKKQKRLITNSAFVRILNSLSRQALHAAELGFEHPRTSQNMRFQADWPSELKLVVEELKRNL